MTDSIQNIVRKFKENVPNTVVMGAKGSGKTFLYREILRNQYWENFVARMVKKENGTDIENLKANILIVPLFASGNAGGFSEIIEKAIQNCNRYGLEGKMSPSIYIDNRDALLEYARNSYDLLEWKKIWKKIILQSVGGFCQSFEELDKHLADKGIKLLFLIDGLEEILRQTISSETEKNAIVALCRDLVDEMKIKYINLGLVIFLRKDIWCIL